MTRIDVLMIAILSPPRRCPGLATLQFEAVAHADGATHPAAVVHETHVESQLFLHVVPLERQPFLHPGFVHAASQSVCVLAHAAAHVVASLRQLARGMHGAVSTGAVSTGVEVSVPSVSTRASVAPARGSYASKS
jgi:hypothetical protein